MKLNQSAWSILGVLSLHPRQSGYHIRKTVENSIGYFWGESFGQIYPSLKKLLAEGLIEEDGPQGPKKSQEYSITPSGEQALKEWLALPYREDPPRDEFLLKLFFGVQSTPEATLQQLQRYRQNKLDLLNKLSTLAVLAKENKNAQHPGFPYWMLTLDCGLAHLRTAVEWSDEAIRRVQELSASPQKEAQ